MKFEIGGTTETSSITRRGKIVLVIAVGLAALLFGYNTGDRCYPTFSAGSCLRMIDQSTQVGK